VLIFGVLPSSKIKNYKCSPIQKIKVTPTSSENQGGKTIFGLDLSENQDTAIFDNYFLD